MFIINMHEVNAFDQMALTSCKVRIRGGSINQRRMVSYVCWFCVLLQAASQSYKVDLRNCP